MESKFAKHRRTEKFENALKKLAKKQAKEIKELHKKYNQEPDVTFYTYAFTESFNEEIGAFFDRCKHGVHGHDCFECYPTKE